MMFLSDSEIDTFLEQYVNDPPSRKSLLASLRHDAGRFFLNVPVYGAARRVAMFLKDGPFSVYYEFEKGLSSYLHPFLSRINGTIITDIMINSHFNRKYEAYRKKAERILRRKGGPSFESLGEIIPEMVAGDGHYMAIKFSDIILSGRFNELHRVFRPIEHTVMNMKKLLGPEEEANIRNVRRLFERYLKSNSRSDGPRCIMRMEWDDELKKYCPYLRDEDAAEEGAHASRGYGAAGMTEPASPVEDAAVEEETASTKEAGEHAAEEAPKPVNEAIIKKYAAVLKQNFFNKLPPDDEEKLIVILDGVFEKNKKKSGEEQALAILEGLAEIWLADESLDEWKCNVIRSYIAARLEGAMYIVPSRGDDIEVERPEIMVDEEYAGDYHEAAGSPRDPGEMEDIEVLDSGDLHFLEDDGAGSGEMGNFKVREGEEETSGAGFAVAGADDITPDNFEIAEQSVQEIEEREFITDGDMEGSFTIAEEEITELREAEIPEKEQHELGSFAISDKTERELDTFDIADEAEDESGEAFDIQDKGAGLPEGTGAAHPELEEGTDEGAFSIKERTSIAGQGITIAAAVDQFEETIERIRASEEKELEHGLALLHGEEDPEKFLDAALKLHETMVLDEHRFAVAGELAGGDTFFGDLMGLLSRMSRILSSRELIAYVDELIDTMEQDESIMEEHPDVIPRLLAYRDSIVEDPAELLQEVNSRLAEITHECGDDTERCVVLQCRYLRECLDDERFSPVKKTLLRIMENLLLKDDPDAVKRLLAADDPDTKHVLRLIQDETGKDPLNIREFFIRQKEHEEVSRFLIKTTAGERDREDIVMTLNEEEAPSSLRFFIQEADKSSMFEEAFLKITKSADFSYKDKILLLEKWLKPRAEAEGWLEEGREDKIARIDRMVLYYSGFLEKNDEVRKAIVNRGTVTRKEQSSKAQKVEEREPVSRKKPDAAEDEDIAADDPAFQQLVKIIRSFSDVIEETEPLLRTFEDMVREEHREALERLIAKYRGNNRELIERTDRMISSGEPDEELPDRLNTASSMMQYIWSRKVMERRKASDLAEVFKGFKDNKEYYSKLDRIMKIIKINNKNDLLKTTVDRELKLIHDIEASLNPDDLKGLWRKTVNRKNKDRIKLFRELLDIGQENG
ncbi:MAG TPA: hypothetical protein PK544_11055 [Spirochaetota bacterium]|nr:hypothetical protein [Spirochaetota bacterium]